MAALTSKQYDTAVSLCAEGLELAKTDGGDSKLSAAMFANRARAYCALAGQVRKHLYNHSRAFHGIESLSFGVSYGIS